MTLSAQRAKDAEDCRTFGLHVVLTRMRQESDARVQAWMAELPNVQPLYVPDPKLEERIARETAEVVARWRAGTLPDVPDEPIRRIIPSIPRDPEEDTRWLRVELCACVVSRWLKASSSTGDRRRYYHARLKQHQLTLAIMRVGRDMRECQAQGWFDRGDDDPVSQLKIDLSRRMRGHRERLMRARGAAEKAHAALAAERARAADETALASHMRL